uniref:Uncharacterized protein n=1 Tax=Anguilla anguilla TaxID=7936 RepID=A0A0E9P803_ANGAN
MKYILIQNNLSYKLSTEITLSQTPHPQMVIGEIAMPVLFT